jgi:hypothetical protein
MIIPAPGSPATIGYNFGAENPVGTYTLEVQCSDSSGIERHSPIVTIAVSTPSSAVTSVSAPSPSTASIGTPVTFTSTFAGPATLCLIEIMGPSGVWNPWTDMTRTGTTASYTYTFSSSYAPGVYPVNARCRDAAGLYRNSVTTNVTVSAAPSVVTSVSYTGPTNVTLGTPTTFSAAYTGTATVCNIRFYSGGVPFGEDLPLTLSGGTASVTFSPTAAHYPVGTHQARTICRGTTGGELEGSLVNITFSTTPAGDVTAPVVATLTPSTATVGTSVTITAGYSDAIGVAACSYYLNGSNISSMSLSGTTNGTATRSETFEFAGTYTVEVRCSDLAGNIGSRSQTVTVSTVAPSDAIAPIVSSLGPLSVVAGSPYSVTAVYSDASGVTGCDLYVGGSLIGSMTLGASTGGTANRTHTFPSSGSVAVEVRCRDAAGNYGNGVSTVSVATASTPVPSGTDTTPPTVGPISPTIALREAIQTYSVSFADTSYITNCTLHVQQGSRYAPYVMSRTGASVGYASYQYAYFASVTPGTYNMYATCTDEHGRVGTGPTTAITVTTASTAPVTPPGGSYFRQLVKLRCPEGTTDPNHPCKAVYYVSSDGKRHAFPNERAYFTWYADFNNVYELDSLSTFFLGTNVTYRPGIRLVKFTTLDRVYAVGRNGLLRWITSETAARALYGPQWNRQIDDISDAFYTNYRFGADINSASDFSPATEAAAVTSVDANF